MECRSCSADSIRELLRSKRTAGDKTRRDRQTVPHRGKQMPPARSPRGENKRQSTKPINRQSARGLANHLLSLCNSLCKEFVGFVILAMEAKHGLISNAEVGSNAKNTPKQ